MTVAELNTRMSAREFSQWMDYSRDEPFGPTRDNLHAGMVAAMIYNANRGKNKRPLSAADFLLMSERERMEQRTRKTMGAIKAVATSKGAKRGN